MKNYGISITRKTMVFIGALFAFAAVYYIINIKFYIEFLENVLPYGDPFTYTSGYFRLLDDAHSKYFVTIARIFYGDFSWYWLTNHYIAFLSKKLACNIKMAVHTGVL